MYNCCLIAFDFIYIALFFILVENRMCFACDLFSFYQPIVIETIMCDKDRIGFDGMSKDIRLSANTSSRYQAVSVISTILLRAVGPGMLYLSFVFFWI